MLNTEILCLTLLFIHLNKYHNLKVFSFYRFATLLHRCLASIKKGSKKASAKEIALASHAIGKIWIDLGMCFCCLHVIKYLI